MWEKIKSWFKHSLTILWARVQVLAGIIAAAMFGLVQDPNVVATLQAAMQPKFLPYYIIAIGVLTEVARRRSAGK